MPCKSFIVPIANVLEAKLLLDTLAEYDLFQLKHNIKPDYSNAGGLSVFDGKGWIDWYSQDGEDIDHYSLEEIRKEMPIWEGPDARLSQED